MDKTLACNALSSLAHETRLDAFRLLIKAGSPGIPAGQIAESLDVVQNTMSSHLSILARAQLIEKTRDGRVIRYHANYDHMRELLVYLLEDCCRGNSEICLPIAELAGFRGRADVAS